jgi:predicted GIY-YIG superfamily endonuclease
MKPSPKTIQIFLPGGDPRGIRIAELTTRIMQAIEVPRSLLGDFFKMEESGQVAVYFLFGDEGDGAEPGVYIGQTGDLRARLKDHNQKKDFWQRAVVLVSRTNSLTQTHALFLEWHSLQEARRVGRYRDENGNAGSRPHTPAPLEADCHEIFDTGRTLLAMLGFPLFDEVAATPTTRKSKQEIFYCKGLQAAGEGLYTPEGFVVLKGSKARKDNVPSIGETYEQLRKQLITDGVLAESGNGLVFEKNRLFKNPSQAAIAVLGRHANGWTAWKDAQGRTLDELKRQTGADSPAD